MVKFLIEYFLIIFIGITVFTQLIVPAFVPGLRYWWIFKKREVKEKPTADDPKQDESNKVDNQTN